MDVNQTWLDMVKAANSIAALLDTQPPAYEHFVLDAADTLASAVRAMNDWLSHQGALPDAWAEGRK